MGVTVLVLACLAFAGNARRTQTAAAWQFHGVSHGHGPATNSPNGKLARSHPSLQLEPAAVLARSSDISMDAEPTEAEKPAEVEKPTETEKPAEAEKPSGPPGKGTPFTKEETDALYQASVSKEKACSPEYATEKPRSKLLNAFTQPQIFYSLLRQPSEDPPEEVWDVIREKWPVLKERSNAELLEALAPIKAKYVDLRFL